MTSRAKSAPKPSAVILAGGRATRMGGRDKGALLLGGRPLLAHVIERIAPQVSAIVLNANGDPARFDSFGLPVVADSVSEFPGPLAGVLAGLDWAAARGEEAVVSVAADTPFFPTDLVARLQAEARLSGLALAGTPDPHRGHVRHPTFGLWPVALRDDLRAALEGGLRKVVLWTDAHAAGLAMFEAGEVDPFFNINTPEDLAAAEAMI